MKSVLFILSTAILVHHTMEYENTEEIKQINTEKPPKEYKGYSHNVTDREIKDLTNMTNDDTGHLQPYCRRLRDGEKVFRKRWFKNVMKWAGNLIGKGHKENRKPLNPYKQKVTKNTKRTTRKAKTIRTTKKPRTIRTTRKIRTIRTTRTPKSIRTTRKSTYIRTTRTKKTIRTTRKPTTIRTTTKPTTTRTTTKLTTIITTTKPTIISTGVERTTTRDRKIIDDMEYAFDIVESLIKNFKRFTKSTSSNNIEITIGNPRSTSRKPKTTNVDYYEDTRSTWQELTTTENNDYESTGNTNKEGQITDDNHYEGIENTRQPNTSVIRKGKKTTKDSNSIDIDHDYYYYL